MGCGRNIRWGAAQWMYRTGSGFPVVGFPAGTTPQQLQAWFESGLFNNLMSRTGIFIAQNSTQENTGMTFEFKGPAGQSLDPTPFYQNNIEQIAIATGYPQSKMRGVQAGAVTGSEVNQQDYFKAISRDQENYCEEPIRWIIGCLVDSGQLSMIQSAVDKTSENYAVRLLKNTVKRLTKKDYRHKTVQQYLINWNSAFELSEKDEATIEESHVRANQGKLDYMSIDEVRTEEGLEPLPDGMGEWKDKAQGLQLFGNNNGEAKPNDPNNPQMKGNMQEEQQKQMNNADKFLLIDLTPKKVSHEHPHPPE
jgi:hypothetical protein